MIMQYRANKTKAAALKGESVKIAEINRVFDPIVVEAVAQAGFTCVWIDMEHSHLDWHGLSNMVLAARSVDIDVVVRLAHGPYNQAVKPLELGAGGLIWPHCKSAEEARQFVHIAKFRPLGLRGMGGGRDSFFGWLDAKEYLDQANEHTLLGVMIEDAEGVEDVEAIAAVEGLDLLFVGPSDLAHSYRVGHEGVHIEHEKVQAAFDMVAAACAANDLAMGTAVGPGDSLRRVARKGARWFNCNHELAALTSGYHVAREAARNIVENL